MDIILLVIVFPTYLFLNIVIGTIIIIITGFFKVFIARGDWSQKFYNVESVWSIYLSIQDFMYGVFKRVQYWLKGLQHYTHVKCVYFTHITRSVHAPYTQIHENACNYMRVITRSRRDIACKITRSLSTGTH